MNKEEFIKTIWNFYKKNKRELTWRATNDPYKIFVSEVMLQQTQVIRVVPKYEEFLKVFPTFEKLAYASIPELLIVWQGLGYNRRALFMQKAARVIIEQYNGRLPRVKEELILLPGIGENTAGSLLAFSYNLPIPFIETNIRTVYLHFFFSDKENITDKQLIFLIEKTIDKKNPREWYYALMDYGVYLKKEHKNEIAKKSKHFTIQSKFEGSRRQIRGKVLKVLLEKKEILKNDLEKIISDVRFEDVLEDLLKEGFIEMKNKALTVKR